MKERPPQQNDPPHTEANSDSEISLKKPLLCIATVQDVHLPVDNDGSSEVEREGRSIPITSSRKRPKASDILTSPSTAYASYSNVVHARSQLYVIMVIVFFAGSSLGAVFVNKTCLTGYHFHYPLALMFGQMTFAVAILLLLHATDYSPIPSVTRNQLFILAIPTVLFTGNIVIGLTALSLVNIPMFSAFRRLTILFVMGAEYVFLGKTHSSKIIVAVIVMAFGAFISTLGDVTFSKLGYLLVFLNNLLTAGYLASIKKAMRITGFDPLAIFFYMALMGLPLVATLLISTGELTQVFQAFRTQQELSTWGFLLSLMLTATGSFAVNFSTSLCTHVTSPLTTSVAGQVKNVLQTILGFFSWGFVPTFSNIVGLLVALWAQLWFAYVKYVESIAESRQEQKAGEGKKSSHGNSELVQLRKGKWSSR